MKKLKDIALTILITIISICAFGGGCFIWFALAILIQPSPTINKIMFYIFTFVPMPFCSHIALKIANKYF